ncbi:WYL domain-containing protein [Thiobacillus denitrificans]|uniref:WYL domain-containing protein n=1 Tax=Thiobacillus denitrificans TaxID=36861 RepID=UPI001EDBB5F8|nr:WYL domain-containing protein [Thiobacillus denitrificans]
MLAHQLPVLPPFDQFWDELPLVFDWLYEAIEKPNLRGLAADRPVDETWQPPTRVQSWKTSIPVVESVRLAAANRLCVDLRYQGSNRLIEPYSLRRSKDGHLLLCAVRHESGESRTYRVDRIEGAEVTKVSFVPKYLVELTPSGPIHAPTIERIDRIFSPPTLPRSLRKGAGGSGGHGPKYIFKCSVCGKQFTRKSYDATLNPHKNKQGHPCYGSIGMYVRTEY